MKSKVRIMKLNALNPDSVFGITSMSDKHVKSQETLHDVKVTNEDGLLSRSMMMKAKDIIMNDRISAVREEPTYTLNPTSEMRNAVVSGLNTESRNLVPGDLVKHDPDIQQTRR